MLASDLQATGLPIDAVTQEWWLHRQLESYHLLAPPLPLTSVKQVLSSHLPTRFKRFAPRVFEPDNAQIWLSFILRADEVVQLKRSSAEAVKVAITLASAKNAQSTLELVSATDFSNARNQLGILKHWVLVMPGYPLKSPSKSELIELFHAQLELQAECGAITFGEII